MNETMEVLRARAESLLAEHSSIAEAAKLLDPKTPDEGQALIRLGARALLSSIASEDRRPIPAVIVTAAPRKGKDDTAGLRSVANRSLLDTYRLCGGKPIGDATREELVESATTHETLARGNMREASFQRAVAKMVPAGARVRDKVGEIDLRRMQAAAHEAVA